MQRTVNALVGAVISATVGGLIFQAAPAQAAPAVPILSRAAEAPKSGDIGILTTGPILTSSTRWATVEAATAGAIAFIDALWSVGIDAYWRDIVRVGASFTFRYVLVQPGRDPSEL